MSSSSSLKTSPLRICLIVLAWWYASYYFAINIKTWYAESKAVEHGVFLCAVSILTQEDTPSWRLLFSLSFIVIGLVFSVYKDKEFTMLSLSIARYGVIVHCL
ncbi:hypothetical protein VYU27_008088 [Nannochloropsis oceanica]